MVFLNSLNSSGRFTSFWGKTVLKIELDGAHENNVEISNERGKSKIAEAGLSHL
jgi:hypothetical protein